MSLCHVEESVLEGGIPLVKLVSPALEVGVLPHKGADIYQVIDRLSGVDVLLKTPQGLRPPHHGRYAADSTTAWLEQYEGGWQEIFPNGGDANHAYGVELSFHGESSLTPYRYQVIQAEGETVIVDFSVKLYRTPLQLTRRMSLSGRVLRLEETLFNYAAVPIEFMWGHHIAFGAPFIAPETVLQTSAQSLLADDRHDAPENVLPPSSEHAFPIVTTKNGQKLNFAQMPPAGERRTTLAYLRDFDPTPWYALVNPNLALGVGVAWSPEVFPYCWLWQEMYASQGFPFYGGVYTLALEPWTSYPGQGLSRVRESTQTQRTLGARESLSAALSLVTFPAPQAMNLSHITLAGEVRPKEVMLLS